MFDFGALMTFFYITAVVFPVVPWLFGARWGTRGVWLSTGVSVVILLCFFPVLFLHGCGDCGQGAIAIFILVPIWIVSAFFTVVLAAAAHKKFARSRPQDREGAVG
jgi:hypothetical protein